MGFGHFIEFERLDVAGVDERVINVAAFERFIHADRGNGDGHCANGGEGLGNVGTKAAGLFAAHGGNVGAVIVATAQVVLAQGLLKQPHHTDAVHLLLVNGHFCRHGFEQVDHLFGRGEQHGRLKRTPVAQLIGVVSRGGGCHVNGTTRSQHQQLGAFAQTFSKSDFDLDLAVGAFFDFGRKIFFQLQEGAIGQVVAPAQQKLGLGHGGRRQSQAQHSGQCGTQKRELFKLHQRLLSQ